MEPVPHDPGPDASRSPEFCNFFEKAVMGIEKEGNSRGKRVDIQAGFESGFDVRKRIRESERQFLNSRRACFADVISADRNRVPVRNLMFAVAKDIGDQAK